MSVSILYPATAAMYLYQSQIFYQNNATDISAETALALAWMGPSITPLTNLNSGFVSIRLCRNSFRAN